MRHRMYDPRTGRFTQTDPLHMSRASEHYVYAFGNPILTNDPQGLHGYGKNRKKTLERLKNRPRVPFLQSDMVKSVVAWGNFLLSRTPGAQAQDTINIYRKQREAGVPPAGAVFTAPAIQALESTPVVAPVVNLVMDTDTSNLARTNDAVPLTKQETGKQYQRIAIDGVLLTVPLVKGKLMPGAGSKPAQVQLNKAAGDAWEREVIENILPNSQSHVKAQITVRSAGPSGKRVRLDAVGTDKATGAVRLTDAKASPSAPFTPNQKVVYPELKTHGGTVVGEGKPPYTGGTEIPPTAVDVLRKPE